MNNDLRSSQSPAKPTHEQIASRAEVLWKAKGSPAGRDEEIWLEAERQLYDEAREIVGDPHSSPASSLSSEEPAMPSAPAKVSVQKASASENMTTPPAKAGITRRRSSGR
ncbi:hypothetical protein DB347_02730 [Opitutaceae bacterium EW11]|nr:hypothetical protein DB347_02730 [Opitutaceae bacterium EW11]